MRRDRQKISSRVKRSVLYILLLCWAFFLFPGKVYASEDYQVTEMHMQGEITASSSLNVRSGPGKNYSEIGKVEGGTVVTITGQAENGWYQIEINGETGYVSDAYVTATEMPDQEETGELDEEAGEPEEGYRGLHQSPAVIKMAVIGLGIIVILGMLAVTLKGLRKDKEYDDDDDEDDEYDEDGYDEDDEEAGYEDGEYEDEDDGYEDGMYGDEDDRDEDGAYDEEGGYSESNGYTKDNDAEDDGASRIDSAGNKKRQKAGKKEYVLREEDYRVMIDPSFFEKEPIEQPAMVTGYLERKKIEEAVRQKEEEADRLSDGLDALQSEKGAEGGSDSEEKKQKELEEAMEKLNELQKEIERLKNRKDE